MSNSGRALCGVTILIALLAAASLAAAAADAAAPAAPAAPAAAAVVELLEDGVDELLGKMTDPHGRTGEGRADREVVFSGAVSARITPMQRHDPRLPGWGFPIRERPRPGEYRYLRFAWKAEGCSGIMLQFHDEKDWHIRFVAGQNQQGWLATAVAGTPPARWTLVTIDLHRHFGDRTIHGMALTVFAGQGAGAPGCGHFDHIYLGRTVEDLDAIDATGVRKGPRVALRADDLERLWADARSADAARAYKAFWTLVADPARATPFLRRQLESAEPDVRQVRRWIAELDADDWRTRQEASRHLADHAAAAEAAMREALEADPTPEARGRLEALIRLLSDGDARPDVIPLAIRALRRMEGPEARACLKDLAAGPEGSRVTRAAREALGQATPRPKGE